VNFDPGQTVKVVPVTVNGDTTHENNETFAITLSSPSGATLGDSDGTETIVDDDPIAPAAPTVQAISSDGIAKLTWTLPADNGSRITAYQVAVYYAGVLQASKSHTVTCAQPCTPARTWTVTGFTSDLQYTFAVSASNARGAGPFGRTTIVTSSTVNAGRLPGRTPTPSATAGTGRVTLTWTAALNGTATVISYTLTPYKNGVLQPAVVVGRTVRSFVFKNDTAGAAYTFEIRATSLLGTGPDSARSNPVRPT
jgi:chitinase